jgi:hypothetical protein
MFFNFPQCLAVVDFLAADWTLVEFQQGNGVGFAARLARPIASDQFDFAAAAGWTGRNL